MKLALLIIINVAMAGFFVRLLLRSGLLSYYRNGRVWLTWLAVAVITLMDELTSVFYAPAEAHRFLGPSAIIFIALTAIFVHYMTTRLVEIAEILEHHGIFGGGVYSFSYLVLGPVVSFVAVASIMVDYILTACISSVSAVANLTSFFQVGETTRAFISIAIIWAVAGLNILGIRESARFTFIVFVVAAMIMVNLIVTGFLSFDADSWGNLRHSFVGAAHDLNTGSWFHSYGVFIASLASCVLAYSGVESVLQTAGLVRTWREIGKAYIFLAATVGVVTPLIAILALTAPIDFAAHEGDLIIHYATQLNGAPFGIALAILAGFTLIMAVNTAFVASSELMERVAERYGFAWLIETNRNQSLYRIHIISAIAYSLIILITSGSQTILADMYALGLIASFCINMGSLIIYRYFMGTKELVNFYTSRVVTLMFFLVFVSCFFFLAWMKPHGTELWAAVTAIVLCGGLLVSQKRSPEIVELAQSDSQMDIILYLAENCENRIDVLFRRPREDMWENFKRDEVYITFFHPRRSAPPKAAPNHFRLPAKTRSVYQHMVALLKVIAYEMSDREITVHFGWPLSSWLDRLSIGVMVYNMMSLPKQFPSINFEISYPAKTKEVGHPSQ